MSETILDIDLDDLVAAEERVPRSMKHQYLYKDLRPADRLSRQMLWDACPPRLRRDLSRNRSLVVVVEAPSPDWLDLVFAAARNLFPNAQFLQKQGGKVKERDSQDTCLRTAIATGQSVVITTVENLDAIHEAILASMDYRVKVSHPTRAQIATTIRATFGRTPLEAIPEQIGQRAKANALLATMRRRESARQVTARLALLNSQLRQETPQQSPEGPRLEDLTGYGAAQEWGLQLASDIAAYRRNELEWSEISSAGVLHGPPGSGKTFYAGALARSCQVPFFATSLGKIFNESTGYLDGVVKALSRTFAEARRAAPSLLFIDELDAIPDRATLSGRGRDWWTTVINHVLKLLDDEREGVVVLGATNMFDRLDSALLRSGRLEDHFLIEPPDECSLIGILRHHLKGRLQGVDLAPLARLARGASGADVARLVKIATAAARRSQRELALEDLSQLLRNDDLPPEQLRRICVHEAGHAVAAFAIGRHVEHVTTIQRGRDFGSASIELPGRLATRKRLEEEVLISLAGRNAELLILGDACDGSQIDLHTASFLVAAIHGSLGLGASLVHREKAPQALKLLDDPQFRELVEVELRLIDAHCMVLMTRHQEQLMAVAETLRERRALSAAEFLKIVQQRANSPSAKPRL